MEVRATPRFNVTTRNAGITLEIVPIDPTETGTLPVVLLPTAADVDALVQQMQEALAEAQRQYRAAMVEYHAWECISEALRVEPMADVDRGQVAHAIMLGLRQDGFTIHHADENEAGTLPADPIRYEMVTDHAFSDAGTGTDRCIVMQLDDSSLGCGRPKADHWEAPSRGPIHRGVTREDVLNADPDGACPTFNPQNASPLARLDMAGCASCGYRKDQHR